MNKKLHKVVKIENDELVFNNGYRLLSYHDSICGEDHYITFEDLIIEQFDGLLFDLTSNTFFNRIEDYGIELIPTNGYSIKVPGYGINNGYYSDNINLILNDNDGNTIKSFDITECQVTKLN